MGEKNICLICGKPNRSYMGNYRKDGLCGTYVNMLRKISYLTRNK